MKTKALTLIFAAGGWLAMSSCTTTYDAYGRPQQSVDPAAATLGAAAAGVTGYAIGRDRARDDDRRYYNNRRHYSHPRYSGRRYGRW